MYSLKQYHNISIHAGKEVKHHYGTADEDKSLGLASQCSTATLVLHSVSHVPFFILKPIKIMIK